jgi:hypothetical protein
MENFSLRKIFENLLENVWQFYGKCVKFFENLVGNFKKFLKI